MNPKFFARLLPVAGLLCMNTAMALSPTCSLAAGENKVSWPSAANPTWEMCWVKPSQSSGPRGSGLELRNVHFRGVLVMKRAHSPMLFAEYRDGAGGNCYRDWKDEDSAIIAEPAVRNVLGTPVNFTATTNCDVSNLPTTSYGSCPFGQPGRTGADCTPVGGVAIENLPANMGFRLTNQYTAGWYKYTARYEFLPNGNIDTKFGFGNSDGTYNNVTHWHQNYWRFDFDIEGASNDSVNIDSTPQTTEFAAVRDRPAFSVTDSNAGFGYLIAPGANDNTYPANQSGRNFHTADVIATLYKPTEYSDRTNNSLGDCAMNASVLANSENIDRKDVVLYYRASVRDSTANNWALPGGGFAPQDSMVCKTVGPTLQMTGTFPVADGDFRFFKDGAE
jgi:hypothetical protein